VPAEAHPSVIGFIAVVAGFLIFYGSVYVLIALNTGWRFGYWVTGAIFGGLLLFFALFWLTGPGLGPRGEDPHWVPLAYGQTISDVQFEGKTFTTPAQYPGGDWKAPSSELSTKGVQGFVRDLLGIRRVYKDPLFPEADELKSSSANCVGYDEKTADKAETVYEKLSGWERIALEGKFHKKDRLRREIETCKAVYASLPSADDVPKFDGVPVTMVNDMSDIRFSREAGTLLGQVTVTPSVHDPRVTGDPSGTAGKALSPPFRIVAYRDPGSLKYPSLIYVIFALFFLLAHLAGLARAQRRKLSPVAV
jgi:hypothetical protein